MSYQIILSAEQYAFLFEKSEIYVWWKTPDEAI